MISKEAMSELIKENKKEAKKLTKAQMDLRIVDWQLFYLNNLDIFVEDYLMIPLKHFQRGLLNDCVYYDIMDVIASRGLSMLENIKLKKYKK